MEQVNIAAVQASSGQCKQVAECGISVKVPLTQQIADFFSNIFSTAHWPARWYCGTWSDFHGWLYIVSDLLIWASYFAIPLLLLSILRKRPDTPFPKIVWLFVAFIVLCGTTHLLDALIFWWPAYRLTAIVQLITGIISSITVYALYKAVPRILSIRSVEELEREIAERKLVEEKLAASDYLLSEAGRIGRVGGWQYEVNTGKRIWSGTVYDIFEIPVDSDLAVLDSSRYFSDEALILWRKVVHDASTIGKGWDMELPMITETGRTIWIRTTGEAFKSENGDITTLSGVFMDIDKYKNAEQAAINAHEKLLKSHQQLKSFTHILSHNVRNHASNLVLLHQLIEPAELDEQNAVLVEKIGRVTSGLNNTLNDLAEAIKIKERPIAAEELSFKEITREAMAVLDSEIAASKASITTDFSVRQIRYPKLYLESIILNLLSNSIKYRKPDTPPMIVLKTYTDTEGETVLECSDNGLGINLALHREKIFGLYKTFHDNSNAHGVGLFLLKTQVESQGGTVQVESAELVGSTFRITF